MDLPVPSSPAARCFAGVTDPRVERTRRHLLCDILPLALCATLAGTESFADMEEKNSSPTKRFLHFPS
jgi:hypothetical protein